MVFVRRKGATKWHPPKYDPKSKYLSIVLHYDGVFSDMPNTRYVGGDMIVVDWIKSDELKHADLLEFSSKAGVKGEVKFHAEMRDGSFIFLGEDEGIQKCATSFLTLREMHIYVEEYPIEPAQQQSPNSSDSEYESFEDPDFVIGNECDDEEDDAIFDKNVDNVGGEMDAIDPTNLEGGSYFVPLNMTDGADSGVETAVPGVDVVVPGVDVDVVGRGSHARRGRPQRRGRGRGMGSSLGQPLNVEQCSRAAAKKSKGKKKVVEESSEEEADSEEEDDLVADGGEDFDETRLSESDEDGGLPSYPVFNPKTIYNPEFVLQQVFSSKKEFKQAAENHAIKNLRSIRFIKNDARRVYVECGARKCKWMIHVLKMKDESSWQIRKFYSKHRCATSQTVRNVTSTWLSERYLQRFQSDKKHSIQGFMEDVSTDSQITISRHQAYKAKAKAIQKIEGDPDAQYAKRWSYAAELRKTNPGSTIILGLHSDSGLSRFSHFYVCFDALKRGFLSGCRPLLGVDGCHLKGKHGGILLTAVGTDGNNNLYPVAWAVVEKENEEIWEWFLTILKQDLKLPGEGFTFISDKQKGLINAMKTVFPNAAHRFCVRHMHNNLKSAGFRGLAYKQAMWKAACSTTSGEFTEKMNDLKNLNEAAWEWFSDKPPEQWSKAFFGEESKCDMLLNNVCESFNSMILDARDKAIITMLEWIREHVMKRLQKHRDRASGRWKEKLCPRIYKILERNSEKVTDCAPLKSNARWYQVRHFYGGQYTVDLERRECSCKSWQLTGIPCTHAISAILNEKKEPEDYVHPYYEVDTYKMAYEHAIIPLSYDTLWGDNLYIPPLPPDFGKKRPRGRPEKNRRLEEGEKEKKTKKGATRVRMQKMGRQQRTVTCRKCGEKGHNSATCTNATVSFYLKDTI